ncbi:MAG: PilZ domain-containing protein [Syntrophales bacterium]|nr:PilZ domain-containing protein [Syntrophales bacterium]
MAKERRRRTRIKANFTATFQIQGGRAIEIETCNVSLNGMLIKTKEELSPGMEGIITLRLSPTVELKILGQVVRTSGGEAAIGFTSIDEEAFVHLKRIVAYNAGDADMIDAELRRSGFSFKERA